MMDLTASFYSRPSHDYHGAGFPAFSGSRRQRGGGILGSLKNFFYPTFKRIGKSIGRSLMNQGVGLAQDVANDALLGKNMKDSLINRGKSRAVSFGKSAAREGLDALSNMIGKGRRRGGRRRKTKRLSKSKTATLRKRRKSSRKRPKASRKRPKASRKRAKSSRKRSKSSHKHSAKRRRLNF